MGLHTPYGLRFKAYAYACALVCLISCQSSQKAPAEDPFNLTSPPTTQSQPVDVTYATGTPCIENNNQCDSGFCVDGVCCDTACDDVCVACIASKTNAPFDGACNPIKTATDPDDECGLYTCSVGECIYRCGDDGECSNGSYCYLPLKICTNQKPDGESCVAAGECASGNCVDGICCTQACEGTCDSCNIEYTGQPNGECHPVETGKDPGNDCTTQPASTCGTTGFCDGTSACAKYPNETICQGAYCDSHNRQPAYRCQSDACTVPPIQDCDLYTCRLGSCLSDCSNDSDCDSASGAWCYAQECTTKSRNAVACQSDQECASGSCVDGVCCENSCTNSCLSCSSELTGFGNGLCRATLQGLDPNNDCADLTAANCGNNGACNGDGTCQNYSSGTPCANAICINGDAQGISLCNALTCTAPSAVDCKLYGCENATCKSNCTADDDCNTAAGAWCYNTACTDKKHQGEACGDNNECASNHCFDGFCCESACTGVCQSCLNQFTGQDNGVCGDVLVNEDPHNSCTQESISTCGQTGACDGLGLCQKYAENSVCANAICANGDQQNESRCASGNCTAPALIDCQLFACDSPTATCFTACDNNGQCNTTESAWCYDNACTDKLHQGDACNTAAQCATGNCVDGFCCESSCDSLCQSCAQSITGFANGMCRNVPTGQDPDGNCTDQTAATCGHDGTCDGSGSCRYYADSTICNPQHCTPEAYAQSDGTCLNHSCIAGVITDCQLYVCDPQDPSNIRCFSACSTDAQCSTTNGGWCHQNQCTDKKHRGDSCSSTVECATGFSCVDGVCCESSCSETCMGCTNTLTNQANGTCANIQTGDDPRNQCNSGDGGVCGETGVCGTNGTCQLQNTGISCLAPRCISNNRKTQDMLYCDGSGTCTPPAATDQNDCGDYRCNPGNAQCYGSCTNSGQCDTTDGAYCYRATNECTKKLRDGLACSNNTECASDSCVDGVCCETSCDGLCQACNSANTGFGNGFCRNILQGNDPSNECTDQGAASCGQNGVCDGSGACEPYPNNTVCASPICVGDDLQTNSLCQSGNCTVPSLQDCALYSCSNGSCLNSCTADSQCDAEDNAWCYNTACTNKKHNGSACNANQECASDQCIDGVCCENSCSGNCQACKTDFTGHTSGLCRPVLNGFDPDGNCQDGGASSCGYDGFCDGSGACREYSEGTVCSGAACINGDARDASTCLNNACVAPSPTDCLLYACQNAECNQACANNGDCNQGAGAWCYANSCTDKKHQGDSCGNGNECASGNCVDGYCCDSACNGNCQACARSYTGFRNGSCKNILTGQDPNNDCSAASVSTCGPDGMCDGQGSCRNFAAGTVCGSPVCDGHNVRGDATCSSGNCTSPASTDCGIYSCTNGSCRTDCSSDSHCDAGAGAWCYGNQCTTKKHQGDACNSGSECANGICVNGVCCENSCGGSCQACKSDFTAQTNGLCRNVINGADPRNSCANEGTSSCGNDGFCDGFGACRDYSNGTQCQGPICANGDAQGSSSCQEGVCQAPTASDCELYACVNAVCLNACTNDGNCNTTVGAWCYANTCTDKKRQGIACGSNSECASDACIDGVCCETTCSESCKACSKSLTGHSNGLCRNAKEGLDPHNSCSDSGPASCGTNGACNGRGGCKNYAAGTICAGSQCNGANRVANSTCQSGTCTAPGSTDCGNYTCSSGQCLTTCSQDSHCDTTNGAWCNTTTNYCTSLKRDGSSCGGSNQCESNYCVDGYCCNSECSGTCQSCNSTYTAINNGVCANVESGKDPGNDCPDQGAGSCNYNGACNGSGACLKYSNTTVCAGATCENGDARATRYCNGSGTCQSSTLTDCNNYSCEGSSCRTSCSNNSHCSGSAWCYGNTCTTLKKQGESCSNANQCANGTCVDGYCCENACSDGCKACNQGSTGHADGLCRNVQSGKDPHNSCSDQGASSCGTNGVCNGSNACSYYATGTQCASATCSNGDVYSTRTCNGSGSCRSASVTDCGYFVCENASCRTTCSNDSHCTGGAWCYGNSCTTLKKQGESCNSPNQCANGTCVDGYCCNSTCGSACQACRASYTGSANGICANIYNGQDPYNDCNNDGASSCDRDGYCNGSGSCRTYASGTQCASATCSNDDAYSSRSCNGSGTCNAASVNDCFPYKCSGSSCRTNCSENGHCAGGYWCYGSSCTNKTAQGGSCNSNNDCVTGNCVDGFCCENSCSNGCQACNNSNTGHANGLCRNVRSGRDPHNTCPNDGTGSCNRDGTCNGFGSCRLYASGTICQYAGCDGNSYRPTRYCNGSGTCNSQNSYACGNNLKCSSGSCLSRCTSDSHCLNGTFCSNHSCISNRAPTANNGSASINEDHNYSGRVSASDPDGDSLNYSTRHGPHHGNLSFNSSNGYFSYSPHSNWSGTDSFQFKARDGSRDSPWRTFTIRVHQINDPPSITGGIRNRTMQYNSNFSFDVTINDVDMANSFLSVYATSHNTGRIPNGRLGVGWINNNTRRIYVYNLSGHSNSWGRRTRIRIRVSDGSASSHRDFDMTVNGPTRCTGQGCHHQYHCGWERKCRRSRWSRRCWNEKKFCSCQESYCIAGWVRYRQAYQVRVRYRHCWRSGWRRKCKWKWRWETRHRWARRWDGCASRGSRCRSNCKYDKPSGCKWY